MVHKAITRLIVIWLISILIFTVFSNWKGLAQSSIPLDAPPDSSANSEKTTSFSTEPTANNLEIRVLLGDNFDSCTLSFQKGYKAYNDKGLLLEEAPEASSVNIVALSGKVKISNKAIESQGIFFQPLSGGYIGFKKLKYRGVMRVFSSNVTKLAVVNYLPLEDYVRAVVPGEMPSTWHPEALKAQTVAARTYAVNRMLKFRKQSYDVSDGQEDQVYLGLTKEREQTNKAAVDTANIIATYNGQPIIAYFCSDAGGKTNQSEVYPYLKSVNSYVPDSPHNNWTWQATFVELENIIKRNYPNAGLLINVISETDPISERMKRITLVTTNGSITVSANTFRNLINPNVLKSTAFKINVQSGSTGLQVLTYNARPDAVCLDSTGKTTSLKVLGSVALSDTDTLTLEVPPKVAYISDPKEKMLIIKGNGWGHGSGLSQWGAYHLAKNGWDWKSILKYFYYGIDLTDIQQLKIPPSVIPAPINLSGSGVNTISNPYLEEVVVNKPQSKQLQPKPEVKPNTNPPSPAPKPPADKKEPAKPDDDDNENNEDDSPEPLPLPPGS